MIFEQEWKGRNCREGDYFPVSVPGNIQYDFAIAKGFKDLSYSDNYKQFIPYENDAWEYVTRLKYNKNDGERVFFVSEGIDYKYDILLNGQVIYSYEGMYATVELDLTDKLVGNDVLSVYVYPHPKLEGAAEGTRDEAAASCKPPVCYGWDWNPRLLISGMWQRAYIETRDEFYIANCEVLASLNDDMTVGTVSFDFECASPCDISIYDMEDNLVWRGNERSAQINTPKLWWCNGQGTPYLYRWVIENKSQKKQGYVGFRKIRLVRNPPLSYPPKFPRSRFEPPATFELNGRRIMAKGSNWVNPELFWGRIDSQRYDELLRAVVDCNMNILRIWGGAGICKHSFYELCDKYGIIVWQEFMLACNSYPSEEHYLDVLQKEATVIIKKLRHHCCIGLWCGGNELFSSWRHAMDDQDLPLRLLNKLCYELDPKRPFLATSPLAGMAHGGYMFFHELQNGEVFYQFQHSKNTAYPEFGIPSASPVETLKKIIPKNELKLPLSPTNALIYHHGFESWESNTWLCPDVVEKYFGAQSDLESFVECTNVLQTAGYKGIYEEARRQWPHCSMALNWCLNEPWETAANNSIIAYPTILKPSYYAVKDSLRPKLFSARIPKFLWQAGEVFEAELWLLNDTPNSVCDTVTATIKIGEEVIDSLLWNGSADINSNRQGPTFKCILPYRDVDSFTLELKNDNGMSSSYYLRYRANNDLHPNL